MSRQHENKLKSSDPFERENERIMKLFNDAASEELSSGSEEPELSSYGQESMQDPHDDCDGEYGSDPNYIQDEDSGSSTTYVSDSEEEGDKVRQLKKVTQWTWSQPVKLHDSNEVSAGLKEIAGKCNFDCKNSKQSPMETHPRVQFIRGLQNSEIKERLLQESSST